MKQKGFPVDPAALHLGILLLKDAGVYFEFPKKMSEDEFAAIYGRFCENIGDGYSSSYNGLFYNEISGEHCFPFNQNYATACSEVSPFYNKVKNVEFEFNLDFSRFVANCSRFRIILSELFPQRFDLKIGSTRLDSKKGRIFKSMHRFLTLGWETYLERVPVELSIKLMDATKFAFNIK